MTESYSGTAGGVSKTGVRSATPLAARFVREISWAGKGVWVKADTHIHTRFSDGSNTPDEIVAKAMEYGCDVIAITDHADDNLRAATPEYAASILSLRDAHPSMVILAGIEWNIPPWGGDEHAAVLLPPGPREWATLAEFKARFDDYHRQNHDAELADEALRWLAENGSHDGTAPVVIYNHPSRKGAHVRSAIERWRGVNELVIGFEGGPGHQGARPLGSYKYEELIDRWDPAAARVGDAWDELLSNGIDVWAACATSDFHNASPGDLNDRWPGQFSETWLYVPEISASGVLRAFRAGSFAGVHGHIARKVQLQVDATGLTRPAIPGEVIEVVTPCSITVTLNMDVPDQDWEGKQNRIDTIELITISKSDDSPSILQRAPLPNDLAFTESIEVPPGGLVIRARGRRTNQAEPSLMFYTNPVRVLDRKP